ncbi:DUF4429 domain-containing protein [Streptomyces atratus]|uniref:Short C-terminal domain-containing protein n=1 Tax=Streptomyces atratus TaxID=1893 RepID=A0A1K2F871_STRAR|nr:DUF4429 domain-containing protein [Streptomyces atratus]SFY43606.1 Short C-terminal domain-containing protein [Streptomyces atratus]
MAEIIQRDGTWTFDGEAVRIVPGRGKGIHPLRQELGECVVPLRALAGISFEPDRKGGRLRLRLRDGACPVLRAAGGRLKDAADPYQLAVEKDRNGVAEYFVDEVRGALLVEQVPTGAVDGFLLPGPAVPVAGGGGDGTASFDGETVRLTWNWKANEAKISGGPVTFPVSEVTDVRWLPAIGLENGHLTFVRSESPASAPKAEHDPYSLDLWGLSKKEYTAVLVAAAVLVRLPEAAGPAATSTAPAEIAAPAAPAAPDGDDHDALLRRLRELGELHRSGVLTDDEFTAAKQAVLKRL